MEKSIEIIAEKLLKEVNDATICDIKELAQAGSARRYYRIFTSRNTYLICRSENIEENETFIKLARIFFDNGINVPKIYSVSVDKTSYLLQDLGDVQLIDLLHSEYRDRRIEITKKAIKELVKIQFLQENKWINAVGFKPFGDDLIKYDFNYSLTQFLNRHPVIVNQEKLQSEFDRLEERLMAFPPDLWGFMYRDFQSRNVMIYEDKPWFIDFQSGRKGPCIYDFVSFAWQARAGFTPEERGELLEIYSTELCAIGKERAGEILCEYLPYFASFRLLQVLGAYGLRGLTERKPHFLASIKPALQEFIQLLESTPLGVEFPELFNTLTRISKLYK